MCYFFNSCNSEAAPNMHSPLIAFNMVPLPHKARMIRLFVFGQFFMIIAIIISFRRNGDNILNMIYSIVYHILNNNLIA